MSMKQLMRVGWCVVLFSRVVADQQSLGSVLPRVVPLVQAPSTFGKTHFIVGMPPAAVSVCRVQKSENGNDDGAPYDLLCQGVLPQIFFSPHDDVRKALVHLINQEKKSLKVAAYALTDTKVVATICEAHKRGVNVAVIVDRSCLQMRNNKVSVLRKAGVSVAVFDGEMGEEGAIMHNKFVLFGQNMGQKTLLCTGSANMTNAAYGRNHENVIVLDDQKVCARYDKEFAFLIKSARKMVKS